MFFSYIIMVVWLKLFNYLDRCITDNEFRVIVIDDQVNVVNYVEVLDFSSREVAIVYEKGIVIIKGNDLVVSKMLDDELLIKGKIKNINYEGN